MDKERRDELFDLVQNLDFDYDILQIDWWEYSDQWTVLINNFRKFNIYQIVRDIHNDAVCRVENESIFKFIGGYFDIVQLDSTAEFNETIFSSFKNFIKDNGIEKDLRELDIRSFSLTFSF